MASRRSCRVSTTDNASTDDAFPWSPGAPKIASARDLTRMAHSYRHDMTKPTAKPKPRIEIVDALRGSALLGILLLHSIEHFDMGGYPGATSEWLRTLDGWTNAAMFFLFGGKAYAVFAMMFGVSFFLLLDSWSRRGLPFGGRFLWRLTILGVFGYVYGIIYPGEVLTTLALGGVPLLLVHRLGDRTLAWVAAALLLQPPALLHVARIFGDPTYAATLSAPMHWGYYGEIGRVFSRGSFSDVAATNLWTGVQARMWFMIETGRYLQVPGLMLLGLLLGRNRVFEDRTRAQRLAIRVLLGGVLGFVALFPLNLNVGSWMPEGMAGMPVRSLVASYLNVAQMAIWVGGFVMAYLCVKPARRLIDLLGPYGRMSLSGYVTQGLIGAPFFYAYGLGMFRYLGQFYSLFFGLGILALQLAAAQAWMRHFHYGPFEWLWRAATFRSLATPLRRRDPEPALSVGTAG